MTEEQAAELERREARLTQLELDRESSYEANRLRETLRAALPRVLAERKRLLAAAKSVAVMVGAANCEYDEQCIAMASAIAYAEEAAP